MEDALVRVTGRRFDARFLVAGTVVTWIGRPYVVEIRPVPNYLPVGDTLLRGVFSFCLEQVHKPGVAAALARLEAEDLSNVKIVQGDAITVLADHVEDGALSSCCIFFPDPFPQDRDSGRWAMRRT